MSLNKARHFFSIVMTSLMTPFPDRDLYLSYDNLFNESVAFGTVETMNLYGNYPYGPTSPFMVRHFSKEQALHDIFSHIHTKKGAPFLGRMSAIVDRMRAMGFDEYFLWKRLPIEAYDWSKQG